MDTSIKPPAFKDAGELAVSFFQRRLYPRIVLSSTPLLLIVLMVGRSFYVLNRLFVLGSNSNLTFVLVYCIPDTFSRFNNEADSLLIWLKESMYVKDNLSIP